MRAGQRRAFLAECPDSPNQHIFIYIMEADVIKQITDDVTANTLFTSKLILTSDEAAKYLGVSKSYLYKMTMKASIPCYKPMGKMLYFNRLELEQWLQNNRCSTDAELAQKAQSYCQRRK